MALFNGWPWTQFQEQNLDWIIRELNKQQKEIYDLQIAEDVSPIIATADYIGLSTVDEGYSNSDKLADFIQNGEQEYLYIPGGKTYNFVDPIDFSVRDVKIIGSGCLKYNGNLSTGYFLTTYSRPGNYASTLPQNNNYYYNIDCSGLINGIKYMGGIHNQVEAHIRNANNIGFHHHPDAVGYENTIRVSVINDNDATYIGSYGVYLEKPDCRYAEVYTRNCTYAFYANALVSIGLIHAWCNGENAYMNSACLVAASGYIDVDEIYCDTMQHIIYLEGLHTNIKIDKTQTVFADNLIPQATYNNYPYRPWDGDTVPAANSIYDIEIGQITTFNAYGSLVRIINLKPIDTAFKLRNANGYRVAGNFRFIPCSDGLYAATNALTSLPTGVTNSYYTITAYNAGNYKVIRLVNDDQNLPIYMIWYNRSTGTSHFFSEDKTYITFANYDPT